MIIVHSVDPVWPADFPLRIAGTEEASCREGRVYPGGEVHLAGDCGQHLGAEQDPEVLAFTATNK